MLKYKLDNSGILAFVAGVLLIIVSNIFFSGILNGTAKSVVYDGIVCIFATLYGPITGILTGFLGVVCGDAVCAKEIIFGDAIVFGLLGFLIGLFSDKYGIREGEFTGIKVAIWNTIYAMSVLATLFFVKPFLSLIMYNHDIFASLKNAGLVVIICIVPVGIIMTALFCVMSSISRKAKNKKSAALS